MASKHLISALSANFKRASTCFFFSAMESCVVSVQTIHGGGVHYLVFSLRQQYLLIAGLLKLSTSDAWLLDNSSDYSFHSSVRNLARNTWSRQIRGEMIDPYYGPSSAHWNIQVLRNAPTTNAIIMFCNNYVAKVLRRLFAFIHHEKCLV